MDKIKTFYAGFTRLASDDDTQWRILFPSVSYSFKFSLSYINNYKRERFSYEQFAVFMLDSSGSMIKTKVRTGNIIPIKILYPGENK